MGYAAYMFFGNSNTVSNDNIDIAVLSSAFTAGGEDYPLLLEISNKNNSPLELVDLVVEYPKSSDSTLPEDNEHMRVSLGTIPAGAVKNENVKIILPDSSKQKEIMNIIYEIKSGKYDDIQIALKLNLFVNLLNQQGAEKIILGCTELSLYSSYISNKNIIDPLAELAKTAVKMAS